MDLVHCCTRLVLFGESLIISMLEGTERAQVRKQRELSYMLRFERTIEHSARYREFSTLSTIRGQ